MNETIGIKIDSQKLTPERFIEAIAAFVSVVQGVSKNVAHTPVNWTIEVAKGSAVLRMRAENPSPESERAVHAVRQGLRSLRGGNRTIPAGFKEPEIRGLRILAALTKDQAVQSVSMKNGGRWEDWPQSVIPIVDSILNKEKHFTYGSIEGEVLAFSRKQGFECTIHDPVYQRDIICYLQKQEAKNNAIEAFSKEARVLADGLIHYAKEGYPVSITADSIRIFPPESELPTLEEVQAIYKLK